MAKVVVEGGGGLRLSAGGGESPRPPCRGGSSRAEPGGREQLSTLNASTIGWRGPCPPGAGAAVLMGELDGRASETPSAAGQYLLVDQGVEIGGTARDLTSSSSTVTERKVAGMPGRARTAGRRDRWADNQVTSAVSSSRYPAARSRVRRGPRWRRPAEQPHQHVEEVDADVGGDAPGLVGIALQGVAVPRPAARDVGEVDRPAAGAPAGVELKQKLDAGRGSGRRTVNLTYITGRGPSYRYAWKGDPHKSGGVATNIGIHLFDMLMWLFGPAVASEVHASTRDRAAGYLELETADVTWFLSIDPGDLPFEPRARHARHLPLGHRRRRRGGVLGRIHRSPHPGLPGDTGRPRLRHL